MEVLLQSDSERRLAAVLSCQPWFGFIRRKQHLLRGSPRYSPVDIRLVTRRVLVSNLAREPSSVPMGHPITLFLRKKLSYLFSSVPSPPLHWSRYDKDAHTCGLSYWFAPPERRAPFDSGFLEFFACAERLDVSVTRSGQIRPVINYVATFGILRSSP